ncbi:MAG: ABC transporter permease [Actinobacteria bacterium]|nr:ABC transporter permease [Actinomycetota bacterium]
MDIIWEGLKEAIVKIFTGNQEIYTILLLTIKISGVSLLFSVIIGIPLGVSIGINKLPGKRLVIALINTGMSIPSVAVGLFLALILWRSGPLGFLELMYTPTAMIVSQIIIATPIIAGITISSVQQVSSNLIIQAKSLGTNKIQLLWLLVKEVKLGILVALSAGFGRAISEVGAVLIIGGNIEEKTRVLTTATLQMVRIGKFDSAIALVAILLFLSFGINIIITIIQYKERFIWMTRL